MLVLKSDSVKLTILRTFAEVDDIGATRYSVHFESTETVFVRGEANLYVRDVELFVEALREINRNLSGVASLESIEPDFRCSVVADRGHLQISGELQAIDGVGVFSFDFDSDQSHLSQFV